MSRTFADWLRENQPPEQELKVFCALETVMSFLEQHGFRESGEPPCIQGDEIGRSRIWIRVSDGERVNLEDLTPSIERFLGKWQAEVLEEEVGFVFSTAPRLPFVQEISFHHEQWRELIKRMVEEIFTPPASIRLPERVVLLDGVPHFQEEATRILVEEARVLRRRAGAGGTTIGALVDML
jgi:hypothetical protein